MKEIKYLCPTCQGELKVDILDEKQENIECKSCGSIFEFREFICERCFLPKANFKGKLVCLKCGIRLCINKHSCLDTYCSHLLIYEENCYHNCMNLFSASCEKRNIRPNKAIRIKTKSGKIINPDHYIKLLFNFVSNENSNFIVEEYKFPKLS